LRVEGALGRGIGWIFWLIAGGALAAFVALITRLAAEKRGAGSTYLDRLYEDFSRWNFYYGNLERFLTLKSCPGLAPDRPRRFLRAGVAGDRRRLAGGRRHVLKKARRWKYSVMAAGSALHERIQVTARAARPTSARPRLASRPPKRPSPRAGSSPRSAS